MHASDLKEPTSHISINGVDQRELYQALYDHAAENGYQPQASTLDIIESLLSFTASAKANNYNKRLLRFLEDPEIGLKGNARNSNILCISKYNSLYGAGKAEEICADLISKTSRQGNTARLLAQLQSEAAWRSRVGDGLPPYSGRK